MGLADRDYMKRNYGDTRSWSIRPRARRPKSRIIQKYYDIKRWFFRRGHPYSKLRSSKLVINLGFAIGLTIVLLIVMSYSEILNSIAFWFIELGTVIALILLCFIILNLYKVFVNLRYGFRGLTNGAKLISIILLILVCLQIYQVQGDIGLSNSLFTGDYFDSFRKQIELQRWRLGVWFGN